MPQMQIDAPQLRDFATIRDLSPEALQGVLKNLATLPLEPSPPVKLFDAIVHALGNSNEAGAALTRQALVLSGWRKRSGVNADELVQIVRDGIVAAGNWSQKEVEAWQEVEVEFGSLVSSPIVSLVASGIDLAYEYTNLWRNARILTDIRPMFSDDASSINGAVVSQTFRLQYEGMDGSHELNVAMDESDVRLLLDQCERALVKAQTAQNLMKMRAGIPTMIAGESNDV